MLSSLLCLHPSGFGDITFLNSNFEKVGSMLVLACLSLRASVQNNFKARVLKFHI